MGNVDSIYIFFLLVEKYLFTIHYYLLLSKNPECVLVKSE